jgi:hypothetical protein
MWEAWLILEPCPLEAERTGCEAVKLSNVLACEMQPVKENGRVVLPGRERLSERLHFLGREEEIDPVLLSPSE